MCAIVKRRARFLNRTADMITRQTAVQDIILRDEDDPCLRQVFICASLRQLPCIEHTAVVAGAAWCSAFVCPLYFAVVEFAVTILGEYVEAYPASI